MLIQGSETTTDAQLLMQFWNARQNPECHSLILKEVDFDVNVVAAFIDTLHSKTSWKSIKLHNCVGGAVVYDVLWAISTWPHIQSFELDHSVSSVGSPAFSAFTYALNYSTTLKGLAIRARTIDNEAGNNLARGIARNTNLHTLDLGGSVMTSSAIGPLSFGLRLNRSLHTLKLDGCALDDADMATILGALQDHPGLKVLSITQNQCHDQGMGAIAALLHYNQLEDLDLSYLVRKKREAAPTPEVPAVQENQNDAEKEEQDETNDQETAADEQGEENGDQPAETKEDTQAADEEKTQDENNEPEPQDSQKVCNTHLKRFAMAGNFLSDVFLESLLSVFGAGNALEELNLFGNRIDNYGVGLILRKIPQCRRLRTLWLGQNLYTAVAAEQLLEMMKTNYTIMDVSVRSFDDSQLDRIQDQLDHYCRLNRGGRRIFASEVSTRPLSLWPLVMERTLRVFGGDADRHITSTSGVHPHSVDALYCLLRGPAIFENPKMMGED